jgi:hypothetical protein
MSRKKLIPATSILFLVCEKLRMEDPVNTLLCWGVRFAVVTVVLMKMFVCWGIYSMLSGKYTCFRGVAVYWL